MRFGVLSFFLALIANYEANCETIAVFAMFIFTAVSQAEEANVEIPTKNDFHLFLLAGQSNMAGRGEIEAQDKEIFPRVLTLSKDESWRLAVDPLHYDLPTAGVGPGKMFGKIVADSDSRITVGLIPAAVGGSPISSWEPGGYFEPHQCHPYDDAIRRENCDATGEVESNPLAPR